MRLNVIFSRDNNAVPKNAINVVHKASHRLTEEPAHRQTVFNSAVVIQYDVASTDRYVR